MVIHYAVSRILTRIDKYCTLKNYSIGDPDIYLGEKLRKMTLPNVDWCWIMSLYKYVKEVVKNCEIHLKEHNGGKYANIDEIH